MEAFFLGLSILEKIFFILASIGSLLLIIQIILMIIGMGGDGIDGIDGADSPDIPHDIPHDVPHDIPGELSHDVPHEVNVDHGNDLASGTSFSLFTVRGIIGFFAVGSWVGLAVSQSGVHPILALLAALASGFLAMYIVAYLYSLMLKFQADGTLRVNESIGQIGKVYLTVPPKGQGTGKINILIQERYVELEAITESAEAIKTEEMIRVVGCYENTVIVERYNS
jgi:hypothetical protein